MRIDVLTIFPGMFAGVLGESILKRASDAGIMDYRLHDIREYAENKHKKTDDYPFGGGAGLVMLPQPIFSCLDAVDPQHEALRICMSPRGETLSPELARRLACKERILMLCGHYEGIDERVMGEMDMELSVGDYVLTGGELPAMVVIDCVSRFVPGVLGSAQSAEEESFTAGLLEYPQYTRPAEYRGMKVPEVLLSGNHAEIAKWRRRTSIEKTLDMRPELIEAAELSLSDEKLLRDIKARRMEQSDGKI